MTTDTDRAVLLSAMLRKMARRTGALRRAYNGFGFDPWEGDTYCAKATPYSPCGPALRASGLCVECLHAENRRLRESVGCVRELCAEKLADDLIDYEARGFASEVAAMLK